MTAKTGQLSRCYLFPGQGGYLEEVFLELADAWPQVRETFEEIDSALAHFGDTSVTHTLLDGPPPRLTG